MPKSFGPIANEYARVLILGTMPSVESRKAGFYYAHPRNRFWQVVSNSFGTLPPRSVSEKTQLLLTNRIALWDVL
ncbi:MAG: DNA-deoxyinosine glycosylase, partial [Firmicutes bacterium]|nr:DNA-deoxyinosine glycosylase [Bacillota bacterium]